MRHALLSLVAICISFTAAADHASLEARLDAYAAPLLADHALSGVVLVGTPAEVLAIRTYGRARFPDGEPLEPGARFRIASITKTFTAAGVQILADRGAMSLDDPLSRFLSGWEPAERITIRHLLLHQSGVGSPDARAGFETSISLTDMIERITTLPLQFEPGTDGSYSNSGYSLLAHVIERASDLSYEAYLSREIFRPLAMAGTRTVLDPAADPSHARGHTPAPAPTWGVEPPGLRLGWSIGSGSLSSTAMDLYTWGVALHQNRLFDLDHQVETAWPYGWGKTEVGGHRGIEQTGASPGFASSLAIFEDGTIVVMLLNLENGGWVQIGRDLAAIALEAPYEIPDRRPRAPLPEDLSAFTGLYEADGHTLDVREIDAALWVYINDWPVGRWLVPIREAEFTMPADFGTLGFRELGPTGFQVLHWGFGESGQSYRRWQGGPPPPGASP